MPSKVTVVAPIDVFASALLIGALALCAAAAETGPLSSSDNSGAPRSLRFAQDTGAKLFALTCITCHKANGLGVPDSVPPLAGSEWVTGSPGRMLRIVLGGMQGEVEVQGEFFNAAMPGWGATLNDFDIAAVSTYVRKSWGNKASPISAATVAEIRKASAERKTPWTAEDLRKIGGG